MHDLYDVVRLNVTLYLLPHEDAAPWEAHTLVTISRRRAQQLGWLEPDPPPLRLADCPTCGERFNVNTVGQRYCSTSCAGKATVHIARAAR